MSSGLVVMRGGRPVDVFDLIFGDQHEDQFEKHKHDLTVGITTIVHLMDLPNQEAARTLWHAVFGAQYPWNDTGRMQFIKDWMAYGCRFAIRWQNLYATAKGGEVATLEAADAGVLSEAEHDLPIMRDRIAHGKECPCIDPVVKEEDGAGQQTD
jgi:hypothetical protein